MAVKIENIPVVKGGVQRITSTFFDPPLDLTDNQAAELELALCDYRQAKLKLRKSKEKKT